MATSQDQVAALAAALERTMRDLAAWSEPPPPLRPFTQPFAMDTMPFEHWLQLVLVPRLHEIATGRSPLPARSNLAAHAVREFDGNDTMWPLVDVLRQLDELSPVVTIQPPGDGRRLVGGVALIVLLSAWAFVAVPASQRLATALGHLFPMTVFQSFSGSIAPGADFQPLRITVTGAVADDGTTRATEVRFVLIRSLRTMTQGPTAPFDFPAAEPPTLPSVLDWLADFGVDHHAAPATRTATEALAVVTAASSARTSAALHDVPTAAQIPVTADPLLTLDRRTPEWLALLMCGVVVLAGAIPIATAVVKLERRRPLRTR